MVYSLNRNGAPVNQWEILTHTGLGSDNGFIMSVQSNGTDNCLYVFIKGSGILCYNLRSGHWTRKEIDTQPIEQTSSALKERLILFFPHNDGQAINLFNTVTDTFYEMRIQPAEGVFMGVPDFKQQGMANFIMMSQASL